MRPRFVRSHGMITWYLDNWHLHLWNRPNNRVGKKGITLKRRVGRNLWRHYAVVSMKYESSERGCGTVRHYEVGWHDSRSAKGDRIYRSKRYLRFKVCL